MKLNPSSVLLVSCCVATLCPILSYTSITPALPSSPPRPSFLCISWKRDVCHCINCDRSGSHLQGSTLSECLSYSHPLWIWSLQTLLLPLYLGWVIDMTWHNPRPRKAHAVSLYVETRNQSEDPPLAHADSFLAQDEDNVVGHHWTASLPSLCHIRHVCGLQSWKSLISLPLFTWLLSRQQGGPGEWQSLLGRNYLQRPSWTDSWDPLLLSFLTLRQISNHLPTPHRCIARFNTCCLTSSVNAKVARIIIQIHAL